MNTDLTNLTDEQLEAELKRRKDAAKPQCPEAKPLEEVDFKDVYDIVVDRVHNAKEDGYLSGSDGIYDAAMEAVFGPELWDWADRVDRLLALA